MTTSTPARDLSIGDQVKVTYSSSGNVRNLAHPDAHNPPDHGTPERTAWADRTRLVSQPRTSRVLTVADITVQMETPTNGGRRYRVYRVSYMTGEQATYSSSSRFEVVGNDPRALGVCRIVIRDAARRVDVGRTAPRVHTEN